MGGRHHAGITGRIHRNAHFAFEPDPRSFHLLEMNVAANDLSRTVATHNIALGAEDGVGSVEEGSHIGTAGFSYGAGEMPVRALDSRCGCARYWGNRDRWAPAINDPRGAPSSRMTATWRSG
jgi:hypothetical protein